MGSSVFARRLSKKGEKFDLVVILNEEKLPHSFTLDIIDMLTWNNSFRPIPVCGPGQSFREFGNPISIPPVFVYDVLLFKMVTIRPTPARCTPSAITPDKGVYPNGARRPTADFLTRPCEITISPRFD